MVSETKMGIDIISQTNRNKKMTINDIVDKPDAVTTVMNAIRHLM